jgi:hypothetical protein
MAVFNHPFTMIVSGATSSGKSMWVKKLIHHRDVLIEPKIASVLYCYGIMNPLLMELKKSEGVDLNKGFPNEEDLKTNSLLIIDDLMTDIEKAKNFIENLFTRISHHKTISVIFITQSLYHKDLRLLKANAHYLVLLRNPSAVSQIRTLASQMYPGKTKFFIESFEDATSKPYSYLLVDSHPQTPEEYRLSTNIFPGEKQMFYLPI